MAEDNAGTNPQAGAGAAPQAGSPEPQAGDGDSINVEKAREIRRENQSLRARLKDMEAKVQEFETAKLSETEKLQRQIKTLSEENSSLKTQAQQATAIAAASKAGALYPDLVAAKLPAEALADDKKTEEALKTLRAQYPALFGARAGSVDGGAGSGGAQGASMNDWIRRAAGRK